VEFRFGALRASIPGGKAWTISISSRMILIEPDHRIRIGQRLQVVIDWPALVDDRIPLKLHVTGRTVSTDETGLAIEVKTYEFRIAAAKSAMVRPSILGSPEIAVTAKSGSAWAR
jgi:hypothetical protein